MTSQYLKKWETPSHYVGHNPTGDYALHAIARDASILDQSNHVAWLALCAKHDPECNDWYTFRASHWIFGWIEYLILKQSATAEFVHACEELTCALSEFPVANDELYSEMQHDAAHSYLEGLDGEELEELQKEANEHGVDVIEYLLHYTDMFH